MPSMAYTQEPLFTGLNFYQMPHCLIIPHLNYHSKWSCQGTLSAQCFPIILHLPLFGLHLTNCSQSLVAVPYLSSVIQHHEAIHDFPLTSPQCYVYFPLITLSRPCTLLSLLCLSHLQVDVRSSYMPSSYFLSKLFCCEMRDKPGLRPGIAPVIFALSHQQLSIITHVDCTF